MCSVRLFRARPHVCVHIQRHRSPAAGVWKVIGSTGSVHLVAGLLGQNSGARVELTEGIMICGVYAQ